MKVQRVLGLAYQNPLLCQRNFRGRWIGYVGNEYAFPDRRPLRPLDVVDVEHHLRKAFIKDARLNLKRYFRSFYLVLTVRQHALSTRARITPVPQRREPG